ncbi:hypothetical protein X011_16350 [Mycobacterium tuberculosis variant microti OV254]|nr:hypothetical protein X011_16350 [Mycobacterium tuberculosis variant microti OV254]
MDMQSGSRFVVVTTALDIMAQGLYQIGVLGGVVIDQRPQPLAEALIDDAGGMRRID